MKMSRRTALQAAIGAMLAAVTPVYAARRPFASDAHALGINLYMLAADYARDIDGTLAAVARIGYREVETSLEVHSAETIKRALTRAGLRCSSLSVLPKPHRGGLSLQTDTGVLAAGAQLLGAQYLTCNLFPLPQGMELRPLAGENPGQMMARISRSFTADDWKRNADFLNDKGAQFKRHGVRFAYHNHSAELAPHRDTNGLAILLERTDPALVHFHMDVGWVVAAGHDPVQILRAYAGRFRLMHVKDVAVKHQFNTELRVDTTEVGAGIIDWRRVLSAAIDVGVQHFAVEQEPPYSVPEMDAARESFAYLSALEI
jgi:sugar phosphate isomerase/epimerase